MYLRFEYHEGYRTNSRGLQLFTCKWLPYNPIKGLVFLCHGYGMECSKYMRGSGVKLAAAGYAVYGIDFEGHGRSAGVRCYITKFDNIVDDCYDYFKSICELREYRGKSKFLYGESMGGAVALLLHKRDPSICDGAVLVAPMCKISDKLKPRPVVVNILTKMEGIIPKWKIVPSKDVINSAFKDDKKRETIRKNQLIYQDKPRLKTALEMMRTSLNLEGNLHEVVVPFLVLQGENDTVTDPEVSKALYERASSIDKTMKVYPGMCHGITTGESDDNIKIVYKDIISWLNKRANRDNFDSFRSNQSYGSWNSSAGTSPNHDSKRANKESFGSSRSNQSCSSQNLSEAASPVHDNKDDMQTESQDDLHGRRSSM